MELSPNINLDEWVSLYNCLIDRHGITDIRKFSRQSFSKQIAIPNTHYFKVRYQGRTIGGNLFYIHGRIAYAHLSAFTKEGYDLGAPYAVKWVALDYLSHFVDFINFGGGTNQNNGLDLFKQGWSNMTRKSIFCGKILDHQKYSLIVKDLNNQDSNWFPAYRDSEHF